MLEFIGSLSESRMFPSAAHLRHYAAEDVSDLAVLYLCALYILFSNGDTEKFAVSYASQTIRYGVGFSKWHSGATDLYVLLYALEAKEVDLDDETESNEFKKHLSIPATLNQWLKDIARHHEPTTHRALFARMDSDFKIHNSSIRAVRRMAMDWRHLDQQERQLTMTRLLQLLKNRAPRSELLSKLQAMASYHHLEIRSACDKDTGICGPEEALNKVADKKKNKGSLLTALAIAATGIAVSNALHKDKK